MPNMQAFGDTKPVKSKRPSSPIDGMGNTQTFSGGYPIARGTDAAKDQKAFRLGAQTAQLRMERAQFEQDKANAQAEMAQVFQTLLGHSMQMAQMGQAAQQQGAYQATNDHLNQYAGGVEQMMLGGGQGQQSQQPMM